MFYMAWDGKGFTVDLATLSDRALDFMFNLRNERVKKENAEIEQARR